MVSLIWFFVIRLKRVEVQVVNDERETTYNIFKKLRTITLYNTIFIPTLLII